METVRQRSVFSGWSPVAKTLYSSSEKLGQSDSYSDALPPISFLDLDKIKGEKADERQSASIAAINMPAPALVSPSLYSGPPPPYSYPSSVASSVTGLAGYISPQVPRRLSDDDKEPEPQRQSLPSIHEALANSQSIPYSTGPSQTFVASQAPHPVNPNAPTTTPTPRSHPETILQGPTNPFAQTQSMSYANFNSQERRPQPLHISHADPSPSRFSCINGHDPTQYPANPKTAPSPSPPMRPIPRQSQQPRSSPMYAPASHPSASGGPQHAYAPYQPTYPYTSQSPTALSYPNYSQPTWRSDGLELDRAEEMRKAAPKGSPRGSKHYGESVKRHLDIFDLETSLNEIAEGSGRAIDFSQHYGTRAHHNQRSGLLPGSLPSLAECDEMMRQQHRVLDSLTRIRDVIVNQQHALAEQRNRDEASKASSEFGEEGNTSQEKPEGGGGFAGSDSKKRRGRNAPPGRCHSCARAETPEWRRGPDGARTLCNACGLHYAKLTRKMGPKASLGSSNLRPKEAGQASP
ncbi:MAG: hypothetical protein MMC33_001426 [Icmadophila ericetorum]|nr:hypothetical protein [Icmadophila ericetorum]